MPKYQTTQVKLLKVNERNRLPTLFNPHKFTIEGGKHLLESPNPISLPTEAVFSRLVTKRGTIRTTGLVSGC